MFWIVKDEDCQEVSPSYPNVHSAKKFRVSNSFNQIRNQNKNIDLLDNESESNQNSNEYDNYDEDDIYYKCYQDPNDKRPKLKPNTFS